MASTAYEAHIDMTNWPANNQRWGMADSQFLTVTRTGNTDTFSVTNLYPLNTNLTKLSFQLDALMKNGPLIIDNSPLTQHAAKEVAKRFSQLNEKIHLARQGNCVPMRFVLTFLGQVPIRLDGTLICKQTIQLKETIYANEPKTNFPVIDCNLSGKRGIQYAQNNEHRFSSFSGRFKCLKKGFVHIFIAIGAIILAPACPFVTYNSQKLNTWSKRAYFVVDVIITIVLGPLMDIILAIKYLAAAIFHPGIIYKKF